MRNIEPDSPENLRQTRENEAAVKEAQMGFCSVCGEPTFYTTVTICDECYNFPVRAS